MDDLAAAYTRGVRLTNLGELDEAEAVLRGVMARSDQPEVRYALAVVLLAQGRYAEAWPLHDARRETGAMRAAGFPTRFSFPRWSGEPLAGKRIMVMPEQGLGDQIQFARYLPWLGGQGGEVTLLLLPPLARLFARSFPDMRTILASGAVDFPDPDFWVTLYDLPALAGATLETLPRDPYLRTPVAWPDPPEGFRIGLTTRGNPNYALDRHRSLGGDDAERLRALLPGTVIPLDPAFTGAADLADTAAVIERLDLVVTTDTVVAHLAGALGKRSFVLVSGFGADWRWLRERVDSPWYPSLRLFRGSVEQGWGPAIDRLAAEAQALAR